MTKSFVGFKCNAQDKILLEDVARRKRITISDLVRLLVFESLDEFDSGPSGHQPNIN